MLQAVILAGGSGTRLWPLSRQQMPKQFLCLDGELSLLEATVARLHPVIARDDVLIVTSEESAKGEAFQPLAPYEKLLEPAPRNTAPAIALAATHFLARGMDPVMVVLPADHVIRDVPAFHACLGRRSPPPRRASSSPSASRPPARRRASATSRRAPARQKLPRVERFKEKPDAATAAAFLAEGGWYWNSGMFVWRASAILDVDRRGAAGAGGGDGADPRRRAIGRIVAGRPCASTSRSRPRISIDHGVLEQAGNLYLVPAQIGWSDVGSWDAVHEIAAKDSEGNSALGNVLAFDCKDTLIRGGKRLVAAVGVEGVSVIETADAVLVAGPRRLAGRAQDRRRARAARSAQEHIVHTTVRRPWGAFTVLEEAPASRSSASR